MRACYAIDLATTCLATMQQCMSRPLTPITPLHMATRRRPLPGVQRGPTDPLRRCPGAVNLDAK